MSRSRHAARQRAVALLYEADLRGSDPLTLLTREASPETTQKEAVVDPADDTDGPGDIDLSPPAPFVIALVEGVAQQRRRLDELIARYARGWTVERMPVVDRNLLRLGLWELVSSDVPVAVVIDEAVELANELSTPDSGRFVNGVLAAVARDEADVADRRAAGDEHHRVPAVHPAHDQTGNSPTAG